MTENGKMQDQNAAKVKDSGDVALMIDGLYNWLTYDLKKLKEEILQEVKAATQQTSESTADTQKKVDNVLRELKYGYQQNQAVYEDVCQVIDENVSQKLDKMQAGESVDADALAETVKERVVEAFPMYDELDTDKIVESVAEKTEAQNQKVLDAVAAIPLAENIDYTRIVEEVGDRVIEIINDVKDGGTGEAKVVTAEAQVDYDKIIYGTAEKVVESLPYPEKIDYSRINAGGLSEAAMSALVTAAVAKAMSNIDYDKLAEAVVSKMEDVHTPTEIFVDEAGVQKIADDVTEKIDLDVLADKVAARMEAIDYDLLASLVVEKLDETGSAPYEVVIDKEGVQQIADQVSARLDSEVVADRVAEKMALADQTQQDQIVDIVMDDDSVQAIANAVVEKLPCACSAPVAEKTEEPVVEETMEAPVEEPVEESAPEVVEEVVEEPAPEVVEEVAPAAVQEIKEDGNELIDAETGMVIRLKRSFTAKLKQSDDAVKQAYSRIKNALKSYKKVNSNVSWHGDRFNFGRDTIARMNIVGKTLGLYLALDPANEEEFKPSVYHQKDVSSQKAYDGTPFMVKVRSEGAVKKAIRLIAALAEKLGCEADEAFVEENYVEEFAFQTTKELLDEGLIKQTKEKKVALNF